MILPTHTDKSETITHNGQTYSRHMVRTNRIDQDTDLFEELIDAIGGEKGFLENEDIICIAESVVAITQSRAYKISEITPGFTARLLSGYVQKSPAGIGLAMPETMQLAVQEVGAPRLYVAAAIAAVTKMFGRKGDFYRIAGERARGIDGPTSNTLPPYNEYATLIPNNPRTVALDIGNYIQEKTGTTVQVIIVDANDIGVNILGAQNKEQEQLAMALCADNPMGQGHEQTPVMVSRKI